jgi:hypothetical protein
MIGGRMAGRHPAIRCRLVYKESVAEAIYFGSFTVTSIAE